MIAPNRNVWPVVVLALAGIASDFGVLAFTAWQVFRNGQSGWWFALALLICFGSTSTLCKFANALLFGIPLTLDHEEDEEPGGGRGQDRVLTEPQVRAVSIITTANAKTTNRRALPDETHTTCRTRRPPLALAGDRAWPDVRKLVSQYR